MWGTRRVASVCDRSVRVEPLLLSEWCGTLLECFHKGCHAQVRSGKRSSAAPPAATTLGWRMSWVAPERGEIEVNFTAGEQFTNPMGNIQGGFLAAMLDDTMGPALVATLGGDEFAATLEIKVNYLRPVKTGELTGHGSVVHRGGSIGLDPV